MYCIYHVLGNMYHHIYKITFIPRYLLRPDLFEGQEVRVEVETKGGLTRGMSVADWKGQWGKAANCVVLRRPLGIGTAGLRR